MSESDAELVRQAQAGDLGAFSSLVLRYRVSLERYATHLLGRREEAEEALQDSLLRAWRAIGRCADPDRVRSWLLSILVNRCRTRMARANRLVTGAEAAASLDRAWEAPIDERTAWREEIHRALATLPADQREAFLLKHAEELSYDEMAAITGTSVPALKMRVSRACDRLRRELEGVYREH
jgi:RNA polymerase sigma-70 factor (ECF subfamily)